MLDTRQAQREIDRFLGQLNPTDAKKALNRALNHTAGKAKTQINKGVREKYKVSSKEVNSKLSIKKASGNTNEAGVLIKSPALRLRGFKPKQTKKGVSVIIMGSRKLIKGAFITTMKSGYEGVFAKGVYSNKEFKFRKKRSRKRGNDNPITSLVTRSVVGMAINPKVINAVQSVIVSSLPKRVEHEINRLMNQ
jgi:hypothetical protein